MTSFPERHEFPSVPDEQQLSNELVKRIRKLRWIGMEDEARALQDSLHRVSPSDPVVAVPTDTD